MSLRPVTPTRKILTLAVLVAVCYVLTSWLITSSVYMFIDYGHAVRCFRNPMLAAASTPGVLKAYIAVNLVLLLFLAFFMFYLKARFPNIRLPFAARRELKFIDDPTGGTSNWMTPAESKNVLEFGHGRGILLGEFHGQPVRHNHPRLNRNAIVFGPPQSGKTWSLVLPNVLQLPVNGESGVVTDPKGEITRETIELFRSLGYHVRVFNLVSMEVSDRWNPLSVVQSDMDAQVLCNVVIANTQSEVTGDESFWSRAEFCLLKALVLYVVHEKPEEERHMASVYDMLAGHTIDDLDAIFSALPYDHPAKPSYNIFSHAQKKVKSDIAIGLGTRLSVFQNSQVRTLTEASDIDLELPGREKSVYYCIIPDTDETFRFLSSLFFTFLFIKLTRLADKHNGPCPVKINFIMDEFCNIGKIPNFEERISTMRSRGIYCMVITQDLPQLQGHFATRSNSRVWQEIIACCDTRMFWAVNDTDTARYLTELLGKGTVEQISYRHERVGIDLGHVTTSPKSRDLLDVSETMRLDMDSAVVQLRGQKPLLIKKLGYTKHPYYRELKPLPVESYVPVYKEVPEAVAEVKIIYPEVPFEEYEEEAPGVKLAAAGDAGVSAPVPSDGQDDEKIEETAGKENHDEKGSGKKNAGKKNKDEDAFWG